jgi:hypothetical protein
VVHGQLIKILSDAFEGTHFLVSPKIAPTGIEGNSVKPGIEVAPLLKGIESQKRPDKRILYNFFRSNHATNLAENRFKETILVPTRQHFVTSVVATNGDTHQVSVGHLGIIAAISGSGLHGNATFN